MADRLLRNALNSIVPNWLANRPGLNTGFKVLYSIALVGDLLIENGWQGLLATFPGVGTETALPLIAQSRGLLQGPNEPNAAFIKRLLAWLDTWTEAGSSEILAQQIQAFLTGAGTLGPGVMPTVRVVHRNGRWTIANPDGTVTFTTAPWNWDQTLGYDDGTGAIPAAVVASYWSDKWIIIAPDPFPRYTGTADPAWIANFGNAVGNGGGHQVPRVYVDGVLWLVARWKAPHTWLRAIIWAADTTSFTPATPTADGTFGNFSTVVAGVQVPARAPGARYWQPVAG